MNDDPTTPTPAVDADADQAPATPAGTPETAGRGQQPVTRNQAAVAIAIVVVGLSGFLIGRASNDVEPVALRAIRSMPDRGDLPSMPGDRMDRGFGGHEGPPSGAPFGEGTDEPESGDDDK
jgi:hypothetical protein